MASKKLVEFLQALGRIPGLGFFDDMAMGMIGARHQVRDHMERAEELRGRAEGIKEMGGELAGGDADADGDGGDKTVFRGSSPAGGGVIQPHAGGDDRTVLRPRPGGRVGGAAAPRAPALPQQSVRVVGSGLNKLVDAATSLFALVGQLRGTSSHPSVDALRQHVAGQIQAFDANARKAGEPQEAVLAARYALCTLVDETVLSTPWGMESNWSGQSVLSTFHNETFGGEKFFQMLDYAIRDAGRNLSLLELMYICMGLGLEGKYRLSERGRSQLAQVQDNLFRTIRNQRGEFERELSPRWRGVEDKRNRLTRFVPLWVVAALAALVLVATYIGFGYSLNESSDPVYESIGAIGRGPVGTVVQAPPPAPPVKRTLTLREVLASDIAEGLVVVEELSDGTQVLIRGDGLFESASATLSSSLLPLVQRIGAALEQFPGVVLVTGHTDSTPLSVGMQLRFPSNWHLSQARAESVVKILASQLSDPGRLKAEGRGANEPLASNGTREGRAKNRRVEITLLNRGR